MRHSLLATVLLVTAMTASATETTELQPRSPGDGSIAASFQRAPAVVGSAGWVQTQDRDRFRDRRDEGRRRGVGAILYSNPDLRGDRYVVQGDYMRDRRRISENYPYQERPNGER